MEISPPTNMQQQGGVKLGADGAFQMDNVPEEMRAILADIQKKKAEAEEAKGAAGGGGGGGSRASISVAGHAPPPPPDAPPPPDMAALSVGPTSPPPRAPSRMSSWVGGAETRASEGEAAQHRLQTENVATAQHAGDEAIESLLLFNQKEQEVAELQAKVASQANEIAALKEQLEALRAGADSPPPPPPAAAVAPAASPADAAALSEATESRERAEEEAAAAKASVTKLTAQLNAVRTPHHRTTPPRHRAAPPYRCPCPSPPPLPCDAPLLCDAPSARHAAAPGEHAVHRGDAARGGDAGLARAEGDPRHRLRPTPGHPSTRTCAWAAAAAAAVQGGGARSVRAFWERAGREGGVGVGLRTRAICVVVWAEPPCGEAASHRHRGEGQQQPSGRQLLF